MLIFGTEGAWYIYGDGDAHLRRSSFTSAQSTGQSAEVTTHSDDPMVCTVDAGASLAMQALYDAMSQTFTAMVPML